MTRREYWRETQRYRFTCLFCGKRSSARRYHNKHLKESHPGVPLLDLGAPGRSHVGFTRPPADVSASLVDVALATALTTALATALATATFTPLIGRGTTTSQVVPEFKQMAQPKINPPGHTFANKPVETKVNVQSQDKEKAGDPMILLGTLSLIGSGVLGGLYRLERQASNLALQDMTVKLKGKEDAMKQLESKLLDAKERASQQLRQSKEEIKEAISENFGKQIQSLQALLEAVLEETQKQKETLESKVNQLSKERDTSYHRAEKLEGELASTKAEMLHLQKQAAVMDSAITEAKLSLQNKVEEALQNSEKILKCCSSAIGNQ